MCYMQDSFTYTYQSSLQYVPKKHAALNCNMPLLTLLQKYRCSNNKNRSKYNVHNSFFVSKSNMFVDKFFHENRKVTQKNSVSVCSQPRPTRPAFSRGLGAPPCGTPRSNMLHPTPPRPPRFGAPASGSLRRAPVLDTIVCHIRGQAVK